MHLWMDVMRDLESVMADYERLFVAWAAGGVDGLVLGPMVFDASAFVSDVQTAASADPVAACLIPADRNATCH